LGCDYVREYEERQNDIIGQWNIGNKYEIEIITEWIRIEWRVIRSGLVIVVRTESECIEIVGWIEIIRENY